MGDQEGKGCKPEKKRQRDKDRLLVGAVYRSPNSDDQRNENINNLVAKAADQTGDFNYPGIKWNDGGTCTLKSDHPASKFLETVTDTYLFQHVKQPTRIRKGQEHNTLDLILTNEEGMVNNVLVKEPLGKSDNAVLSFIFRCYHIQERAKKNKIQFLQGKL